MEIFSMMLFCNSSFQRLRRKILFHLLVEFETKYAIMVAGGAMPRSAPDSPKPRFKYGGRPGIAFAGSGHIRTMYGKRCFACM
jgi:hypothetical protein